MHLWRWPLLRGCRVCNRVAPVPPISTTPCTRQQQPCITTPQWRPQLLPSNTSPRGMPSQPLPPPQLPRWGATPAQLLLLFCRGLLQVILMLIIIGVGQIFDYLCNRTLFRPFDENDNRVLHNLFFNVSIRFRLLYRTCGSGVITTQENFRVIRTIRYRSFFKMISIQLQNFYSISINFLLFKIFFFLKISSWPILPF